MSGLAEQNTYSTTTLYDTREGGNTARFARGKKLCNHIVYEKGRKTTQLCATYLGSNE